MLRALAYISYGSCELRLFVSIATALSTDVKTQSVVRSRDVRGVNRPHTSNLDDMGWGIASAAQTYGILYKTFQLEYEIVITVILLTSIGGMSRVLYIFLRPS